MKCKEVKNVNLFYYIAIKNNNNSKIQGECLDKY